MKSVVQIIVAFCALCLLSGCGDKRVESVLVNIDTVISSRPDSALLLLDSLKAEKPQWPKSLRMRHDLLTMKAQNKACVDFTSDSVGRMLVDYYDSHGTTNERVMAHYLLGCAYRDLGEAPRAVNSYMDAIAAADTTAADFDFYTLSAVYSQLAGIYHRQLLLTNEIEARRKASHYAYSANQPLWGIYNLDMSAGAYILLNKKDSAEIIQKQVMALYDEYGYHQRALQTSETLMYLYTEQPGRLSDFRQLMDRFEAESNLFDDHHELPPSDRQYYYYKGRYYEGIGCLDSAEYYYRKISHPNMNYVEKDPIYKGLLSVFQKRYLSDSIAKYAQLYCEANDSSIALKDRDLTAQMAASYNYSRYQQDARVNEAKAFRFKIWLFIVLTLLLMMTLCGYIAWNRYKQAQQRKQQELDKQHQAEIDRLKAEFANASVLYGEKLQQLRRLDEDHKHTISFIKQQLKESKRSEEEANERYNSEKTKLLEEINILKSNLESLERREEIATWRKMSIPFVEAGIIQRIKIFMNNPQKKLSDGDLELLVKTINDYYPDLIFDLSNTLGTERLSTYVCILTALNVPPGNITHLLGVTSSQVSNLKQDINHALFGDKTARTLSANLNSKYKIPKL